MKKFMSLLLIGLLLLSVSACGTETAPDPTATAAPSASSAPPSATVAPTAEAPYEVNVWMSAAGGSIEDGDAVYAAINEITLAKTNTFMTPTMINWGSYNEQVNLMFSSGDKCDLLMTGTFYDYANILSRGYLLPLEDLVGAHGSAIASVLGDYLSVGYYNDGHLYGLTTQRDLARGYCLMMATDLYESLDFDFSAVDSFGDFDPLFAQLKTEYPDKIVTGSYSASFNMMRYMESYTLSDQTGDANLGVYLMDRHAPEFSIAIESEQYLEDVQMIRQWYQNGYMLQDITTNEFSGMNLHKSGQLLTYGCSYKPGEEGQAERQTGVPMSLVMASPVFADTITSTGMVWGIPTHCENPGATMAFLNLMYEDADIVNLFSWGLEGMHYVQTGDGHITYPEGVTVDSVGFKLNLNWCWGDTFKAHIWEGDPLDLNDRMSAHNAGADKSIAMGFLFDSSSHKPQVASIVNTYNEYARGLENGVVDPAVIIPEYLAKLKASGIDDIVAAKQAQLSSWLER
ncbi:ABC transporter substrate-binding protein [Oscillospiraceae bacterium OttesenSCG-928-F05]|nr:ABC transporter substrate-binding protein [Oscillospiraceae bacterium OttesenSCG-928-F05]